MCLLPSRKRGAQDKSADHIEARGLEFQERVRHKFLELAEEDARRIVIIDGQETPDAIQARVLTILRARDWLQE